MLLLAVKRNVHQPKSLEIDIIKYKGVDEESMLRCSVDLDDAMRARRFTDEDIKITFACTR